MSRRREHTVRPHEKEIEDWPALQEWYRELQAKNVQRWLFRGLRCWKWELTTKLERVAERFDEPLAKLPSIEKELLAEFQRNLHLYTNTIPDEKDTIRWLALMQHYGAPTRLLDWTYSFYVGVFHAIEHARRGEEAALWVLDNDWYWRKVKRKLPIRIRRAIDRDPKRGKTSKIVKALMSLRRPLVYPENPWALDDRLAVQQGVFLMPIDLTKSFRDNLNSSLQGNDVNDHFFKLKLCCDKEFLKRGLSELQRMNITRVSLFPGLDGFARSLENLVAMPHRFDNRAFLS